MDLTASPCYATNTSTTIPKTDISRNKKLINAVYTQFLLMCRNIGMKFLSGTCMHTTLKCLGERVIQTNPSKF